MSVFVSVTLGQAVQQLADALTVQARINRERFRTDRRARALKAEQQVKRALAVARVQLSGAR